MKYTLLVNKNTNEKAVKINKTGEVIKELDDPVRYSDLSRKAITKNEIYKSLGLVKVRGNLGGTYWE